MMYRVDWLAVALDALADVYVTLDLADQDRLAAAVDALNKRLAGDPYDEGESRGGPYRITFIDRLVVRFWVDEPSGVVHVTAVAPYGR
jgi:hypothetical protein